MSYNKKKRRISIRMGSQYGQKSLSANAFYSQQRQIQKCAAEENIVCRSSHARSIRLVNDENKSNTCFHIPLLEHFSDVDFCCRTSQYLNYHLPQKYERFQNDLCAIKISDKVKDQTGMILTGDVLVLIRHPDHFVLNTGTLILVWKPDGEYVFMRYNETLDASYKIIAAVTEIQRSL